MGLVPGFVTKLVVSTQTDAKLHILGCGLQAGFWLFAGLDFGPDRGTGPADIDANANAKNQVGAVYGELQNQQEGSSSFFGALSDGWANTKYYLAYQGWYFLVTLLCFLLLEATFPTIITIFYTVFTLYFSIFSLEGTSCKTKLLCFYFPIISTWIYYRLRFSST